MTPTSSAGNKSENWLLGVFLAILGLTLVLPWRIYEDGGAKPVAAKVEIDLIMAAIEAYKNDVGGYPQEFGAIRPYLTKGIPKDPWGREFVYTYRGGHGEKPNVTSLGADGKEGGKGSDADIVSWQ